MTAGMVGAQVPQGKRRIVQNTRTWRESITPVLVSRRANQAVWRRELAPIVGLADEIVDIVDTGNTLKANGLEPRELIAPSDVCGE